MMTPHDNAMLSHARQTGSTGSVNIYFFLVIFVLALGTWAVAFHMFVDIEGKHLETAALEEDAAKLEGRHLLHEHYLEEMVAAVGMTGEYAGRTGVDYGGERIASTIDPAALSDAKRTFATETGVTHVRGIHGMLLAVANKARALEQQKLGLESTAAVSESMKTNSESVSSRVQNEFSQEVGQLNKVVSDDASRFAAQHAARQSTAAAVNAAIRDVASEISTVSEERASEVRELTEAGNRLIGHNTAAVEKLRLRIPHDGIDGRVVADRPGVANVVINLGRKDQLVPGVVFRITDANSDSIKAHGTVISVSQETAQMRVHDLVSQRNPVVRGDKLHHPLFTPNVRRNIYLMGRFGYPFEGAKISEQLREVGNRVVDEFVPGVDLVLVGQPVLNDDGDGFRAVESTDEYGRALALGVEFVNLSDVRDVFRFD